MDCRDITLLAVDRLAGEASEASRRELAAHLAGCENCRCEMARLEDVWTTLGVDPDAEVTPEFRRRTLALLEEEMIRGRVRAFHPRPAYAKPLLQAASLLVAAGLGYLAARGIPASPSPTPSASYPAPAVTPTSRGAAVPDLADNPRLSNVSYRAADAQGRVGIGFDVTTRHEISGTPGDPDVAKLLAYLVAHNGETAGEKSRAIELVSEHYGAAATPASPDANTIQSLKEKAVDPAENGFVRAKAASALKAISF